MEKFRELFSESRARVLLIGGLLIIALAVPITMRLVSQQQDLRQQASDQASCPTGYTYDGIKHRIFESTCGSGGCQQYISCIKVEDGKTSETRVGQTCVDASFCGQQNTTPCSTNVQCSSTGNTQCGSGKGYGYYQCKASDGSTYRDREGCYAECSPSSGASPSVSPSPSSTPLLSNGRACTNSNQCQSGYCSTTCQNPPQNSVPSCTSTSDRPLNCACTSSGQCNSGLCLSGKCVSSGGTGGTNPSPSPSPSNTNTNPLTAGAISGRVTAAGTGLSGVSVEVKGIANVDSDGLGSPRNGPTVNTTTNSTGNYSTSSLATNVLYRVTATAPTSSTKCYNPDSESVTLSQGRPTATVDLALTEKPCPTATPPTSGGACGQTCSLNSQCGSGCSVCESRLTSGGLKKICVQGPTATPTRTPTKTPTPTKGITPGVTVTITPTATRTPTPSPTPTFGVNDVGIQLNLQMPGIGQTSGDNRTPTRANRTASIVVYDTNNNQVSSTTGTTTFDGTSTYKGTFNLGSNIPAGVYYVKSGLDNTLISDILGVIQLVKGQPTNTPTTTLIPGDLDRNNILDIRDYNIFLACYGNKQCTQKTLADFNDNGTVEPVDYNILLRSFAIRPGD